MSGYQQVKLRVFNMGSQNSLKSKLNTLCELKECSKSKKHNLAKHLNNETLDLLTDSAFNIVNAKRRRIPKRTVDKLKPFKKELIYLANPKNATESKRRRLVRQKGAGFLTTLLSVAVPLLTSILSENRKSK